MSDRLHICQTCMRYEPPEADGRTLGQHLTDAIAEAREQAGLSDALVLRKVPCLSGCLRPCNVSFRAPGKSSIRFSKLRPEDAPHLIEFARQYMASTDGEVPREQWPEALQTRLTATTPAPGAG